MPLRQLYIIALLLLPACFFFAAKADPFSAGLKLFVTYYVVAIFSFFGVAACALFAFSCFGVCTGDSNERLHPRASGGITSYGASVLGLFMATFLALVACLFGGVYYLLMR